MPSNSSLGNGPEPDAGRVGLGDPDHPVDVAGADAGPGAGSAGDRVRRGHVGIRAVVEVEEGGLRALEEDVLAGLQGVVDEPDGVGDVGREPGRQLVEVALGDLVGRQRQPVVDPREDGVLLLQRLVELGPEDLGVEQVLHPQPRAQRLVGVRRPDAATCRAEGVAPEAALGEEVELDVVRQDQVGVARHLQPAAVDAPGLHAVDLVEQHRRLDHDAVADDRHHVVVEHARRQELEGEGLTVHDDRVAGVVATLVADHHGHLLGQQVGELPLALVSPLGADDDGCRHWGSSRPPTGQPRDQSMVAARRRRARRRKTTRPACRGVARRSDRWTPEAAQVERPGLRSSGLDGLTAVGGQLDQAQAGDEGAEAGDRQRRGAGAGRRAGCRPQRASRRGNRGIGRSGGHGRVEPATSGYRHLGNGDLGNRCLGDRGLRLLALGLLVLGDRGLGLLDLRAPSWGSSAPRLLGLGHRRGDRRLRRGDSIGHRRRDRRLRRGDRRLRRGIVGSVVGIVGSVVGIVGSVVVLANEQPRARIDWSPWPG